MGAKQNIYDYCNTHEFISEATIEGFKQSMGAPVLLAALQEFKKSSCPKCGAVGRFKWRFLGKLTHPDCGWSWYMNPGEYIGAQLKAVFSNGMDAGTDMSKNERGAGGCFSAIFGFLFGVAVRLPFALLMIPIQAVVSLTQQKPEAKEETKDIMLAAQQGDISTVQNLLDEGIDVNTKRDDGRTALMYAAWDGHTDIVQLLLKRGAKTDARDVNGVTPLIAAAWYGYTETVQVLLDNDADIAAKDKTGTTSLMWTAGEGYTSTVQALLDRNADVNAKDQKGYTALIFASKAGHTEVVKLNLSPLSRPKIVKVKV